jgi:gamma-glutamylcyclotransferase (GGCT)/AIG2-like uncharacterized protein YtfP
MKQVRISIATLLLALTSLTGMGIANADDKPEANKRLAALVNVVKSEKKKFELYIPATLPQGNSRVSVSVTDADGNVLYNGQVKQRNQQQLAQPAVLFNFQNLADGDYTLTAESAAWWYTQNLTVNGNVLTVNEETVGQLSEPTVTSYAKNKVEVLLPTRNVNDLNVWLYNTNNEIVYTSKLVAGRGRYDLNNLPIDDYTLMIGSANKQFKKLISIK